MKPQVIVVPGNPLDIRSEDLQPLIEQMKLRNDLNVEVRASPQRGYGVTWWEVLTIYLVVQGVDAAVKHLYKLLLDQLTEKVKHWYLERRANKGNTRPLSLTFRNKEGYELRKIDMRATGETEDVTSEESEIPPRPPPKARRKATQRRARGRTLPASRGPHGILASNNSERDRGEAHHSEISQRHRTNLASQRRRAVTSVETSEEVAD